MKHFSKSLLALLTLTLFGGAGAWAQGPTTVFEVDFSSTPTATTGSMRIGSMVNTTTVMINQSANTIYTIRLGAAYNYSANRYFSIKPETGSFQTGDTLLIAVCYSNSNTKTAKADIYAANGTTLLFTTAPGINGQNESGDPVVEKFVLEQDADSLLIGRSSSADIVTYVTTLKVLRPAADQAIELTKSGANQWTLGQTPDYDLELQVEYYEPHALKDIPAGWQVMVNGVAQTQPYQGDSLMITETDSVTLIPDNLRRVKSVTLKDELPPVVPLDNTTTAWTAGTYAVPAGGLTYSDAITVSGDVTLTLTDGETLTLNKGISLAEGATLTVEGNGTMNVNGTNNSTASTVAGTGTLVLTSGTLTATGGKGQGVLDEGTGAAGGAAINGTVIVDGGTLTAKGGDGGNVGNDIIYCYGGAGGAAISGSVTVNSGTLTATGGNGGIVGDMSAYCSGGAGGAAIGGSLTINAGTMTTTNGAAGSGGAAGKAVDGTVTDNR